MEFCEKYHVSMTCLLLMGIRTYFQKMNGFDDVSINSAIAPPGHPCWRRSAAVPGSIPSPSGPIIPETRDISGRDL